MINPNKILNQKLKTVFIIITSFLFFLNLFSFVVFENSYSLQIYLFSFIGLFYTLFFVYVFFNFLSLKNEKKFISQIFIISILVSLIYAIFYNIYFYYYNNSWFEFNAKDSVQYYNQALIIYENFISGNSIYKGLIPFVKFEDLGFSTLISFLWYFSFKSLYTIIFFNILIKSFSAVYIYKIGKYLFNELDAKLSAIIFVFLPVFNYYSSINLKEIFMIFMLLVMAYNLMLFLYEKKNKYLIFLVILLILMLFIRPVNSILIISIIPFFYLFNLKKISIKTLVFISAFGGLIFFFSNLPILQDSITLVERSSDQFDNSISYSQSRKGGNKLASKASIPLLFSLSFLTPLSTSVKINNQEHFWIHLSNNFLLGSLSIFFMISVFKLYQKSKYIPIISIILFYFLIITVAGLSTSVRRYLPIVPFILILIPYGIRNVNKNFTLKFLIFNFFILGLTIVWNVFKVIGKN